MNPFDKPFNNWTLADFKAAQKQIKSGNPPKINTTPSQYKCDWNTVKAYIKIWGESNGKKGYGHIYRDKKKHDVRVKVDFADRELGKALQHKFPKNNIELQRGKHSFTRATLYRCIMRFDM